MARRADRGGIESRGLAVLVAYYVPPAAGIASQRMTGFIQYLPSFGWDVIVVAPRRVHHNRVVGSDSALSGARVIRTYNPEPSRWIRVLAGAGDASSEDVRELQSVASSGWAKGLRDALRQMVYVPDAQMMWIPWATRGALAALRDGRDSKAVVFSSSVPFSAHFAARSAARRTGVPWVAEYRDPWSVAPPQFGSRMRLRALLDKRMDRGIMCRADHVVVTSDATRELFLGGFSCLRPDGVTVVRNGWGEDGGDGAALGPPPGGPVRLVYTGTLLRAEWGEPLLRALEAMEEAAPGSVTLDVYGPKFPWTELMASAPAMSMVRLHGLVPGDQIAGRLAEASATVILQPDAVRYVPGKIYDYLGARRPILAGVPEHSEVAELAQRHGDARLINPFDPEAILGALKTLLGAHRRGDLQGPRVPLDAVASLSRRSQSALLAGVFDTVGGSE